MSRASAAVVIAGVVGLFPGWSVPAMANRGGAPAPDSADLSISKTGGPSGGVAPGGRINYTIIVRNAGPDAAEAVSFTDPLPAGTTLIETTSTAPGATCTVPPVAGVITCQLGTMAAGDTAEFVFIVLVDPATPAGTLLTNTAQVTSTTGDPDLTNNSAATTTFVGGADLAVTKTAPLVVSAGQPLIYTIMITNLGPSAEPLVLLSDLLPASTTFLQASPGCFAQPGTVSCQFGPLAPGGQLVVTVVVMVDPTTPVGTVLTNIAAVRGADDRTDPNPNNNFGTATTTVVEALAPATTAGGGGPDLMVQPADHASDQGGDLAVAGTELPRTGSRSLDRQITTALALIAAGMSVLVATRRRRDSTA